MAKDSGSFLRHWARLKAERAKPETPAPDCRLRFKSGLWQAVQRHVHEFTPKLERRLPI